LSSFSSGAQVFIYGLRVMYCTIILLCVFSA
jgi:hypothetical protein